MTSSSSNGAYLLDTNVVSEARRRRPAPKVGDFLDALHAEQMYVSVLTIGELRKGAELRRRTDAVAADRLSAWIESLEVRFASRVLPVDRAIAELWGRLTAVRSRPVIDTLIAATAMVHDLTLVTRNTRDFADTGVALVNPWE